MILYDKGIIHTKPILEQFRVPISYHRNYKKSYIGNIGQNDVSYIGIIGKIGQLTQPAE